MYKYQVLICKIIYLFLYYQFSIPWHCLTRVYMHSDMSKYYTLCVSICSLSTCWRSWSSIWRTLPTGRGLWQVCVCVCFGPCPCVRVCIQCVPTRTHCALYVVHSMVIYMFNVLYCIKCFYYLHTLVVWRFDVVWGCSHLSCACHATVIVRSILIAIPEYQHFTTHTDQLLATWMSASTTWRSWPLARRIWTLPFDGSCISSFMHS